MFDNAITKLAPADGDCLLEPGHGWPADDDLYNLDGALEHLLNETEATTATKWPTCVPNTSHDGAPAPTLTATARHRGGWRSSSTPRPPISPGSPTPT